MNPCFILFILTVHNGKDVPLACGSLKQVQTISHISDINAYNYKQAVTQTFASHVLEVADGSI
jgi:hypothetical protein